MYTMADQDPKVQELVTTRLPHDEQRRNSRGSDVPDTDIWHGLSTKEAEDRLALHGYNELDAEEVRFCYDVASCALRSEEHTSELQSLMRISYAVFCLKK